MLIISIIQVYWYLSAARIENQWNYRICVQGTKTVTDSIKMLEQFTLLPLLWKFLSLLIFIWLGPINELEAFFPWRLHIFFLIDSYIWFPSNNFFLCFRCGRWYFVCLVHLVLSALSKPPMCYEIKPLNDPSVLIFLQLYSIIQLTFFFNNRFRTFWQKWNWTKICKGMPFNYLKSGFYLIFPKVKDRVEIEVAGNYYLRFNLTTLCVFVSGSSNKTWSVIIY